MGEQFVTCGVRFTGQHQVIGLGVFVTVLGVTMAVLGLGALVLAGRAVHEDIKDRQVVHAIVMGSMGLILALLCFAFAVMALPEGLCYLTS